MKAPQIKLSFYLCLLLLLSAASLAQENNPIKHSDDTVEIDSLGLQTFHYVADFSYAVFDSSVDFSHTEFHEAYFKRAEFKHAQFSSCVFQNAAYFQKTEFHSVYFSDAVFQNVAYYYGAEFYNAHFGFTKFNMLANFSFTKFNNVADFYNSEFRNEVHFLDAEFQNEADFSHANFSNKTLFQGSVFHGVVNFSNTTFNEEIDFRECNFDSITIIYLEGITFPESKLRFHWEQFKGKDSLRIKLQYSRADSLKAERYTRIEIIYHKLRDNFLAQGNESSADDVMYELGWQRAEILKEFHWQMYGLFFGYGYQPWRFLLFIVAPIILLFAMIWYWFYYTLLVFINPSIFPKIVDASALRTKEKKFIIIKNRIGIKLPITDFKYALENVNRLTRYWHAIFFSASVLLGIRFKKDWTTVFPTNMVGRKTFIYVVTFQWILGIGLYVTFALLVKGIRFSFIKDLLGF